MIGNVEHYVDAKKGEDKPYLPKALNPYVFLSNNDDSHYWQGFESWAEVEAFITQVRTAAVEAFGEKP